MNLTLLIAAFLIPTGLYYPECKNYENKTSCISDCNCDWCYSENSTLNDTACVSSVHSDKICPYWNGKIIKSGNTEYCKNEFYAGIILLVSVPVILFIFFGVAVCIIHFHRKRQMNPTNAGYTPIS